MLGVDQGQGVRAVVDPRNEAAEHFVADHPGHLSALDAIERVEWKNEKELVFHRGVADVDLVDMRKATFHHAFTRAGAGQLPFDFDTELLGERWRTTLCPPVSKIKTYGPLPFTFTSP